MGANPGWNIDGPLPRPRLYSLLNAISLPVDVDAADVERWAGGVRVFPFPPDVGVPFDPCAQGTSRVKASGGVVPLPEFGAFGVYLTETCSSVVLAGAGTQEARQAAYKQRASLVMQAVESAAVERELLAGDAGTSGPSGDATPFLADGNGTFPWGDTPTSVVNGFALLEDEIAASGREGMIHCSPGVATAADSFQLLHRDERSRAVPLLRTINGTIVVPGAGYATSYGGAVAPVGHDAPTGSEEWVYATGPVEGRRSDLIVLPDDVREALDREQNVVEYRAERDYVLDWDTAVQSAVLIDRCTTACGTPA